MHEDSSSTSLERDDPRFDGPCDTAPIQVASTTEVVGWAAKAMDAKRILEGGLAVADDHHHCHLALGLIRVVVCLRSFQLPRGGSTALQLILRVGCHLDVSGFLCYASLFLPFSIRSVFGFTQ